MGNVFLVIGIAYLIALTGAFIRQRMTMPKVHNNLPARLYSMSSKLDTEAMLLVNVIPVPLEATPEKLLEDFNRVYLSRRKASDMLAAAAELMRDAGDAIAKAENIERVTKGSKT